MKTETNHTPGPFAIEKNVIAGGTIHLAITNRKNGKEWMLCSVTPMDRARPVDFANAAFIVRACNSHEKLLEACKLALEAVADPADWNIKARPALQAAIALASQEGK